MEEKVKLEKILWKHELERLYTHIHAHARAYNPLMHCKYFVCSGKNNALDLLNIHYTYLYIVKCSIFIQTEEVQNSKSTVGQRGE